MAVFRSIKNLVQYRLHWITCVLLLIFFCGNVYSKTYYVSANGNDDSNGLSRSGAWQTIPKVNDSMNQFRAGDSILFCRGDHFYGTLTITTSGSVGHSLYFGAYGKGEAPVFSGTSSVENWHGYKPNVWTAHFESQNKDFVCKNVFRNGRPLVLGRWPNLNNGTGGYRTLTAAAGKNEITDSLLADAATWSGGKVVIRYNHWTLNAARITGAGPHTLQFLNKTNYKPVAGWGYFIEDHLSTLDTEGEWFYDVVSKQLYLYSLNDPSSAKIEVTSCQSLIILTKGTSHVKIQNLELRGGSGNSISAKGTPDGRLENITVDHCRILNAGQNALDFSSIHHVIITENDIYGCNDSGISLTDAHRSEVSSNKITATSLKPGSACQQGASIKLNTRANDSVTIQGNYCDSTGYSHILFGGSHIVIKNNVLKNYCMVTDDGAAVYCYRNALPGDRILQNIILNGHSSPGGVPQSGLADAPVAGIYLDDSTHYVKVTSNTIAKTGIGIMLNNTSDDTVRFNKVFSAETAIRYNRWKLKDDWAAMRNLVVSQNVLCALNSADTLIRCWDRNAAEIRVYGLHIDSNYLLAPLGHRAYVSVKENDQAKNYVAYDLMKWQKQYGHDLHSIEHTYGAGKIQPERLAVWFAYNTGLKPKKFNLPPGIYLDPSGSSVGKTVEILPFCSLILYRKD